MPALTTTMWLFGLALAAESTAAIPRSYSLPVWIRFRPHCAMTVGSPAARSRRGGRGR